MVSQRRFWFALMIMVALVAMGRVAAAQERPTLRTNEGYVDELMRAGSLTIDDPMSVFDFVFGTLPDKVKVYPTENYYYFSFVHSGVAYYGNIRIEPQDEGNAKVHFFYGEEVSLWRDEPPYRHVTLDPSKDVTVERVDRLVYRISYRGKSFVFALNDLSQVKPPHAAIAPDERFIGPIFDESGIRFFLLYNSRLRIFHYVLDETVTVADQFVPVGRGGRIVVGKRTGFAYYLDHHRDRKILIGVSGLNVALNNYFDGPFDQLPDNFIEGETLREAILQVDPSLKGQIDRFGSAPDGETRFMIAPYIQYEQLRDLERVHTCAMRRVKSANYARCFVNSERDTSPTPRRQNVTKSPKR